MTSTKHPPIPVTGDAAGARRGLGRRVGLDAPVRLAIHPGTLLAAVGR